MKSGSFRSGAPAPRMNPGRGRGGPRGSFGVGDPKRPQRRPFQRVRTAFERLRWGWGPDLGGPVRACTPMHAHPCTAMYGDVRPCTGMHGDARSPLYGDVRRCTGVHALVRPGMYAPAPPCTAVHARPCTGMYGGVRPCTLAPVRRCTEVYARARSAMYAHARRRTPVYGGVRLRGPRGEKGEVYGNTLGLRGACPCMCGRVRRCTGVHALVRGCTLVPCQAGLSYKLSPCKGPCS